MSAAIGQGLAILEQLAAHPDGLPLSLIAQTLDLPRSASHRLLAALVKSGYVRQLARRGDYVVTTRVVSLGLAVLAASGIVDLAQPAIERLAESSGGLVRLSLVDGDRLTWVTKADGSRRGFRYDPDLGMDARLSCTASGHAWLMTLSDEEAVALVSQQGFGQPRDYGPNAPTTIRGLLGFLHAARVRGFAMIDEVFAPGMAAVAAPVRRDGRPARAVLSIAAPRSRFAFDRMLAVGPIVAEAACSLATMSSGRSVFTSPPLGQG